MSAPGDADRFGESVTYDVDDDWDENSSAGARGHNGCATCFEIEVESEHRAV